MKVGYNKPLAFVLIGLGFVNLALAMLVGNAVTILSAVICLLVGISFAAGHQLEITERELRLKNPFGMTLKRYPLASPDDLAIQGKRLFILHDGIGERVKGAGGMMADAGDWSRLEAWIADQRGEGDFTIDGIDG